MSEQESLGLIFTILGTYSFVMFAIAIAAMIGFYKIFEKAGVEGWKAIIPIYNLYCLTEIVLGKGIYFLAFLIPVVNVIFMIYLDYKLSKCFRKSFLFFLGLVFLYPIFIILLGFGDSKYYGPETLDL